MNRIAPISIFPLHASVLLIQPFSNLHWTPSTGNALCESTASSFSRDISGNYPRRNTALKRYDYATQSGVV
jgi:hypothetical protein